MKVKELLEHLKVCQPDDEVVILLESNGEDDMTQIDELEDGDLLDIVEAGGYESGLRTIRARPR